VCRPAKGPLTPRTGPQARRRDEQQHCRTEQGHKQAAYRHTIKNPRVSCTRTIPSKTAHLLLQSASSAPTAFICCLHVPSLVGTVASLGFVIRARVATGQRAWVAVLRSAALGKASPQPTHPRDTQTRRHRSAHIRTRRLSSGTYGPLIPCTAHSRLLRAAGRVARRC